MSIVNNNVITDLIIEVKKMNDHNELYEPKAFINNITSRIIYVFTAIITAAFILSLSIAAPIFIRPFYYAQISMRNLEAETGFTHEQIKEAYDDMVDYCIGINPEFGTGDLRWSESGKSHFDDVRALFLLDLRILAISLVLLAVYLVYSGRRNRPGTYNGRSPLYYGAAGLLITFILPGGMCALNFNYAFTVFHKIFFLGKSNWLFDPETDEIIKVLPEGFFASCAILILAVMMIICITIIILTCKKNKKHKI